MAMHDLRATFTKGEVTPLVHAREDLELYKTALADVKNFTVLKQGGLRRRSGTRFKGPTKATTTTELIPFSFNDAQSYALEFGNNYIRFWTDTGQIVDGGGVPIEVATPWTAAQVSRLQWAQANDVLYLAYPDQVPKKLNRFSDVSWTLTDVAFEDGPYLPVNNKDNTAFFDGSLQQGDTYDITHDNTSSINNGTGFVASDVGRHYRIQALGLWVWGTITARLSSTKITIRVKNRVFIGDSSASTWTFSGYTIATGNTVQIVGDVGHDLDDSDVDTIILLTNLDDNDWWAKVKRLTGDRGLEVDLIGVDSDNIRSSQSFQLGAFSGTTGYPGSVVFCGGRLCWARTKNNPRGVALSVAGFPEAFSPTLNDGTVTDDLGMFLDVTAGKSDEFHWLIDGGRLLIGSPSSLRSIGSSDANNSKLAPNNVGAKLEIPTGSIPVLPIQIGPNTFAASRFGKGITNVAYQYEAGGLVGPEQSILSEHLFHGGIRRMAYTESPEGIIWSLMNDGVFAAMTYDRYEEIDGFSVHPTNNGVVKSILALPSANLGRDVLYLIVQRTIDDALVQYVEIVEKPFYNDDQKNAFFVDCGGTYNGAPTNVVTGATWLIGQTVDLLADGAVLPQVVVSETGTITLPNSINASVINFGIPIDAYFTFLPLAVATQEGNQRGLQKRVSEVILDFYETRGGTIGVDGQVLFDTMLRAPADPMGHAPPLFTGTKKVTVESEWDSPNQVTYVCDQPLPATVRAVNIAIIARP